MVGDKWFIKKEEGVFGPVSADELQNLIEKGRITLDQEASQNETGPWEPLKSYDLFHEIPHPIEEMFESNDESTPDGNPETVPLVNEADGKDCLSPDVRAEYYEEVSSHSSGRTLFYAFIAFCGTNMAIKYLFEVPHGWWNLLWILISLGPGYIVYKRYDKKSEIDQYSDQMLELKYNEIKNKKQRQKGILIICGVIIVSFAIFTNTDFHEKSSKKISEFTSSVVAEGTQTINEDKYFVHGFELKGSASVKVTVELENGPPVDVYFMDERNFNKWKTIVSTSAISAVVPQYYHDLGVEGLSMTFNSKWIQLEEGRYCLLIDNTDYGSTIPPMNFEDDIAVATYKIVAK